MSVRNVIAIVVALLASAGLGWWLGQATPAQPAPAGTTTITPVERQPLFYRHPMGGSDISLLPKQDSMGMDYIAVHADELRPGPDGRTLLYYRNPMGLADLSAVPKKDSMGMDYIAVHADEAPARAVERKLLYYRNPMGLADMSPVPKKDSMGMDYIAVYADEAAVAPGTVVLGPEKIQRLGVRTSKATLHRLAPGVRASGAIAIDESRRHAIAPRFEGWIETLQADRTGIVVRRGQALAEVYSPELLALQNEYLVARRAAATLADGDEGARTTMDATANAALERLRNWGFAGSQIERLRAGEVRRTLTLVAPASGTILEKRAIAGMRFMPGEMLFEIADLGQVWLLADVASQDSGAIALGQSARFESPSMPGNVVAGTVDFIEPGIQAGSRTLRVRIALANPTGALRPNLPGQVTIATGEGKQSLTVPLSAVIDSGRRQAVLLARDGGRFVPRKVVTGRRDDERVEILEGLLEGDEVVVSANFLIDAESNLRQALDGMQAPDEAAGEHAGHGG